MNSKRILTLLFIVCFSTLTWASPHNEYHEWEKDYTSHSSTTNIRNTNGKFYAYIVLLFNENPHFINLIQSDTITEKNLQNENFNVIAYTNYLKTIKQKSFYPLAKKLLLAYLNPNKFKTKELSEIEKDLIQYNIIIDFPDKRNESYERLLPEYCIFGKKSPLLVKHPFFENKEQFYIIKPLIYYDEFTTSNSTFYYDMIYINFDEVKNDALIATSLLNRKDVSNFFFVGSPITQDIAFCLNKAFNKQSPYSEILKMFEIHELTHKLLNNELHFYEQIIGEELALSSTIYENSYLGLAVMYSYLQYNAMNPHRIGAENYIHFLAKELKRPELKSSPQLIKNLPTKQIKELTKKHFFSTIENHKKKKY